MIASPLQTADSELQACKESPSDNPLARGGGHSFSVGRFWSVEIVEGEKEYRFRTPNFRSFEHVAGISHNGPHVCDAAPRPKGPRGRCGGAARRSAAEPEAPSEAPMHIRAVMRIDIIEREQGTSALNTSGSGAPSQEQTCPRVHTTSSAIRSDGRRLDSHFQDQTKDSGRPYLEGE
jgi:hypothetical protein